MLLLRIHYADIKMLAEDRKRDEENMTMLDISRSIGVSAIYFVSFVIFCIIRVFL